MLWVWNVGEGVEGGVAGLVGLGESGRADWRQGGDGLLRPSFDGWDDTIKDIDQVPLFLLDLGGG